MPKPRKNLLGPLRANRFVPPQGQKKVYLPNFTLTLLRTPFAAPNHATFITPLHMNKLDLKDYLYNLYGVQALSIRSYVQQARVRHDKPGARLPKMRRWYRPRATKRMTIEMPAATPFLYPPPPTDFSAWDQEVQQKAEKGREEEEQRRGHEGRTMAPPDGKQLRKQAEELLSGKRAWRPGWMDWGIVGRGSGSGSGKGEVGAGVGM
ncbi:MAG: hypothetical protein Q9219_003801 [cf. Caloplaca sp. 3 TL-2023]